MPALCNFEAPTWLIFGPNVEALVYYSHLPIVILSLVLGLYVFFQNRRSIPNQVLFFTILAFVIWVFLDSVFWASNRSDVVMFVWSLQILFEPLVYMGGLYLVYVLLARRDAPFLSKLLVVALYAPLVVFVPTRYILSGFTIENCLAVETLFSYYSYVIEGFFTLWLIAFALFRFYKVKNSDERKNIFYLTLGTILFFVSFAWGNITGSFTEDWALGQYGLFGMPLFTGFLVYSIVKFKTFNIKLIGTQALVVVLWISLAAVLFVPSIDYVRIIVSLTLMLFLVIGLLLIRSVKREVEQRERIEKLAGDLERANERLKVLDQMKSEFVSIASHQLRSPLAAMKGYASLILEGSFGKVPPAIGEAVEKIFDSTKSLTLIVEDFLNVSRIEQGRMKYDFADVDIKQLAESVVSELMPSVNRAKLTIMLDTDEKPPYIVSADIGKIKQVITNLIDNAVKYTPHGSIRIHISKEVRDVIRVTISDTGIGMNAATIADLFQKFTRAKDANKTNVLGTGLGLYVARQMVEAHGGRIWAESSGPGKGSSFIFELKVSDGLSQEK